MSEKRKGKGKGKVPPKQPASTEESATVKAPSKKRKPPKKK